MTILIVTPLIPDSLQTSRTETTFAIYDLVKYWSDHEVVVIKPRKTSFRRMLTSEDSQTSIGPINILSVPYFKISALGIIFPRLFARRAQSALRRRGILPDVVIGHYHLSILFGFHISRRSTAAFLPVIHKRDIEEMSRGADFIYRRSLPAARTILIRSHALKQRFAVHYPGLGAKSSVVSSGVPTEYVLPKADYLAKVKAVADRRPLRLITAATLIPLKNHAHVVAALASLERHDFHYRIVGDGPERDALATAVNQHHLTEHVRFLGRLTRDEVLSELADSDVFIMVSNNETFGIAYLEALAKGCIVIGAKGWGIDGVVVHGDNGFLCEPKNSYAIAEVLRSIYEMSTSSLAALADRMYQTIVELDEESASRKYLSIVESAVQSGSDSPKSPT